MISQVLNSLCGTSYLHLIVDTKCTMPQMATTVATAAIKPDVIIISEHHQKGQTMTKAALMMIQVSRMSSKMKLHPCIL